MTTQPLQCHTCRMAAPRDENSPDDLITAKEALHKHHVEPATIRQWVSRGHIKPRGRRARAYLYDRKELLRQQTAGLVSTHRLPLLSRQKVSLAAKFHNREISTSEVARLYGVSPATVRSWVARSQITPTRKEGSSNLFRIKDLIAAEEARCDRAWEPHEGP